MFVHDLEENPDPKPWGLSAPLIVVRIRKAATQNKIYSRQQYHNDKTPKDIGTVQPPKAWQASEARMCTTEAQQERTG